MRLLLIEDDEQIRNTLENRLSRESYAVDTAQDGDKGSYMARTNIYDLIILDNVLPKKSGLEVCEEVRKAGKKMPIIIISIKGSPDEKTRFLDKGADDYITKPFSFMELCARARAHLRRPYEIRSPVLTLGDISLDSNKQKVVINEEEVYLTRKEFLLLECFMKKPGDVISRGAILEHVWNEDGDPFSNTIEAHILNLRKKIERKTGKMIKTVPGRGYKIEYISPNDISKKTT
jgi:DNA-binding response OmpR family regulator